MGHEDIFGGLYGVLDGAFAKEFLDDLIVLCGLNGVAEAVDTVAGGVV